MYFAAASEVMCLDVILLVIVVVLMKPPERVKSPLLLKGSCYVQRQAVEKLF